MSDIPGWLSEVQAFALYSLSLDAVPGVIVEIGSFWGKSTAELAGAQRDSESNRSVICIDPHSGTPLHAPGQAYYTMANGKETYFDFVRNMKAAGVWPWVTPFRGRSREFPLEEVKGGIALIFIDGDHTYPEVAWEIATFLPLVVRGGVVAFHDATDWTGVNQAVNEWIQSKPAGWTSCSLVGNMLICRRDGEF